MKLKHICFIDKMEDDERPIDLIKEYFTTKVENFDFGMLSQRFVKDPDQGLVLVSEMEVPDASV